ncbi:PP2C family protein-serine/threonine phosphatase [Janthinobacterium sp. GB1R12]|uniref:PP2C family protein-serine/threonine phosphatase n=1 Tax=Janthinobacterium sp. GB1R12 TaxID=3424190 RepID=UPI003F201479
MASEKLKIQTQLASWLMRRTPAGGVRRVVPLAAAIASEVGNVRTENQDRAVIVRALDREEREYAVIAIADGIGGMRDGAECASLALAGFVSALDVEARRRGFGGDEWIKQAVFAADRAVYSKSNGNGGATLVALVICPGLDAHWVSVGDSRVYAASGRSLTQLSVDDTIAGQLRKSPDGAFEQSKLLQFIGMGRDLEPHVAELGYEVPEAILLTTDGVHYLSTAPNWLGQIAGNAPDPGTCVKRLVELAKWCGGPDNATCAMVSLTNWEHDELPSYPCLEVWDAFGELQILYGYDSFDSPQRLSPPSTPKISIGAALRLQQARSDGDDEVANLKIPPRTQKKQKSSSRRKLKDLVELTEDEVPQLSMKFPTKSNE